MATRHNLNTNPGAKNDVTGWQRSGANAPTRVTGLTGAPVTTGAQYASGTYQTTSMGVVDPATQYALSVYAFSAAAQSNKTLYANFTRSSGGDVQPTSTTVSIPAGTWTRLSMVVTSPALANGAGLLLDGVNAGVAAITFTAAMAEPVGTLDTYFDGDSPGATWDGTDGSSASTLNDTPAPADGSAAFALALAVAPTGARNSAGTAAAGASLIAAASGARTSSGAVAATTGLTVAATGSRSASGSAGISLGLAVAVSGDAPIAGNGEGSAAFRIALTVATHGGRPAAGSAALGLSLTLAATSGAPPHSDRPRVLTATDVVPIPSASPPGRIVTATRTQWEVA